MKHLLFPLLLIPDSRCNLDMDSFQAQHFSSRNKAPGAPMNPCQSVKLFNLHAVSFRAITKALNHPLGDS